MNRTTFHYEYFVEQEATAWACYSLLDLIQKLKLGVDAVALSQSHVGDITLSINYSYHRKLQAPQ
jgi:hypothetical protein